MRVPLCTMVWTTLARRTDEGLRGPVDNGQPPASRRSWARASRSPAREVIPSFGKRR
jgi:hypothetical protein